MYLKNKGTKTVKSTRFMFFFDLLVCVVVALFITPNLWADLKTSSDNLNFITDSGGTNRKTVLNIGQNGVGIGCEASANLHLHGDFIQENGQWTVHQLSSHGFVVRKVSLSGNITSPITFSDTNGGDITLAMPDSPHEGQVHQIKHTAPLNTTTITATDIEGESQITLNSSTNTHVELHYTGGSWMMLKSS